MRDYAAHLRTSVDVLKGERTMAIVVTCDECGKKYRVGDDKAGKRMRCRECSNSLTIPAADDFGDDEWEDSPAPARRPAARKPGRAATSGKSRGSARKKSGAKKSGKAKGKSKKGKSSAGMSPVVKYSIAGGIVLATALVVFIILQSKRGDDDQLAGDPNPDAVKKGNPVDDAAAQKYRQRNMPLELEFIPATFVRRIPPDDLDRTYHIKMMDGERVIGETTGKLTDQRQPSSGSNVQQFDPGTAAPRRVAREVALKQIALAFHNHNDTYYNFPHAYGDGEGKTTGLSWRVHLLPFLGQNALYNKFKLNEPWNSPHNKALIAEIPAIYRIPGTPSDGKTAYHVFTGPNTPFPEQPVVHECQFHTVVSQGTPNTETVCTLELSLRIGSQTEYRKIRRSFPLNPGGDYSWIIAPSLNQKPPSLVTIGDGTDNTILAVVGGPETATEWTRPGGLPFIMSNPKTVLGTIEGGEIDALFFSGRYRKLPAGTSAELLSLMIQPDDRQKFTFPGEAPDPKPTPPPKNAGPPQSLGDQLRAAFESEAELGIEVGKVLKTVVDEQSAEAALPKLKEYENQFRSLQDQRLSVWGKASQSEEKQLEAVTEKYLEEPIPSGCIVFHKEAKRILSTPGLKKTVGEIVQSMRICVAGYAESL